MTDKLFGAVVYVDDDDAFDASAYAQLFAHPASHDAVHALARRIKVPRARWVEGRNPATSHYDLTVTKRAAAVVAGAVEVTFREKWRLRSLWTAEMREREAKG